MVYPKRVQRIGCEQVARRVVYTDNVEQWDVDVFLIDCKMMNYWKWRDNVYIYSIVNVNHGKLDEILI